MIYSYLFEAKSIQSYLFASNKMKDVISASERLDNLISTHEQSLLAQVLDAAALTHDLYNPRMQDSDGVIHFVRCKGGAFYSYCTKEAPLKRLRSVWTLTLQQLFPSLIQFDAMAKGVTLHEALELGHEKLAQVRNLPQVNYPIATAISERAPLTGKQVTAYVFAGNGKTPVDSDVELHRAYYESAGIAHQSPLQERFTPETYIGQYQYEQSFESFQKRDLALVHIDGNGLGKLLIALKDQLNHASAEEYRYAFRQFSDAIEAATIASARQATEKVLPFLESQNNPLAMRPIVLGGDDVTLFIKAEAAVEFAREFCKQFSKASKAYLQPLVEAYPAIPNQLSASGGIVYHKVNHPFSTMHHLVEGMCSYAKSLTKSTLDEQAIGPAALGLLRVGTASQNDADTLLEQSLHTCLALKEKVTLSLGLSRFYVEEQENHVYPAYEVLKEILENSTHRDSPVSMTRWRQMATHLQAGDHEEASRIYHRGRELCRDSSLIRQLDELLEKACPKGYRINVQLPWVFSPTTSDPLVHLTIINDLLLLEHYQHAQPNLDTAEE
ncbi:Cas10/Cmr2 second palm domain-containing protein [Vibrio sp. DNB22_19_1]